MFTNEAMKSDPVIQYLLHITYK